MEFQYHTFSNGMRLVHKRLPGKVAHCGVSIKVGSRNELEHENGMAHFLEHLLFKGTQKRKAYQVISRLEKVGGDMNAFTSKEDTCIYASFLTPWYERAIELFFDILFHSSFPPHELEKEKEVIMDEINSYNDSPAELIFDDFEQLLFKEHPFGRNILGTPESLKSFTRNDVITFVNQHYIPANMVMSSVGDIELSELVNIIEQYINMERRGIVSSAKPIAAYTPEKLEVNRSSFQSHCIIGNRAYSMLHPQRLAFAFLNNLLGGPAMNSKLNLNIREKYGFCYNLESNYTPYSDTGVFSIYMGTDQKYMPRTMGLVMNELKKLRETKLTTLQFHSIQKQFVGQLALMSESKLGEMLGMGKSVSLINKVESFDEIIAQVNLLTSEQVLEVANEVFDPNRLSVLSYISNQNGNQ